jgi:hypothetical protein
MVAAKNANTRLVGMTRRNVRIAVRYRLAPG